MSDTASRVRWSSHFSRVYCITHLPYAYRLPRLVAELKRVGLLDSGIFEIRYTTPGAYDKTILDGYTKHKICQNTKYLNQALEREKIIKEARLLGYERILILEDDVAFLKDLSLLDSIFSAIPDGYEFVQFDTFVNDSEGYRNLIDKKRINAFFADSTGHNLGSALCNMYTVSGMDKHIQTLETCLLSNDLFPGECRFKRAIAVKRPCIQALYRGAANLGYGPAKSVNGVYVRAAVNPDEYNLPDGYTFDKAYDDKQASGLLSGLGAFRRVSYGSLQASPSCWSRFDRIVMLSFTKDREKRLPLMEAEFDRVGLTGRVEVEWNFPSPLVNIQAKGIGTDWGTSIVDCSLGHYRIIKKAYELGAQNLLVMEDDVRFLKDLDLLREIVTTLPDDYDHAKLNWVIPNDEYVKNARHPSPHWVDSNGWGFHSTGMYCMSRRMMEARIRLVEGMMRDALEGRKADFRPADLYDKPGLYEEGLQRYACVPQLAVQTDMGDRKCSGGDLNRLQGLTDETRKNYAD